jgi:hypothetical protein
MKTTLKTLICTALCCAAGAAFAIGGPPATSTTTLVDFEFPAGTPVTSVGLGAGDDVHVKINVTSSAGATVVATGTLALEIAVDSFTGNPTTVAGANLPGGTWARIATANPDAITGDHTFPVNLDGLAALSPHILVGIDPVTGEPIYLQNVTCDNTTVGFRGHFIGVPSEVIQSQSAGSPLTIECDECGTSTDLTLSLGDISGPGSPSAPGSYSWCYTFTVQNCTDSDLTGIKVQGGTSGWTTLGTITPSKGTATSVTKNKTSIITWILDLAQGESATITVCVSGTLKAGACGTTQFISGPWSAAFTDPVSGLPLKSDYTDRASIEVICP